MLFNGEFTLFMYLCLTILNFIIFSLLIHKYATDTHKKSNAHNVTKLLAILTFFLLLDSMYQFFLHASQRRIFSPSLYIRLSNPKIELGVSIGLFLSLVMIVHFLMEKRIEQLRDNEKSIDKLQMLNHELEKKTKELEHNQEVQERKLDELERFNKIAHQREAKMLGLIRKIEELEAQIKSKKST